MDFEDHGIDRTGILTDQHAYQGRGMTDMQGIVGKTRTYGSVRPKARPAAPRWRARVVIIAACVAAALLATYLLIPASDSPTPSSFALDLPKVVSGHVYDSQPIPVAGATVTVRIMDGSTERTSQTTTTDGSGFYTVTFFSSWSDGNTIKVDAAYDSQTGTSSVVADTSPAQTVDVYFSVPIPEFGSAAVVCVAVLVIFVMLAGRSRRRPDS